VLPRYLLDMGADSVMMARGACSRQRIKSQQDVLTGDCSTTIVQRWATSHSLGTAIVPGCPTAWCCTMHGHDVARQWDETIPMTVEDIINYF
jgi:hypothetical protein